MRIGIDYTSAVRQSAGIGRYTRSLVSALARADVENQYVLLVPSDARTMAGVQLLPERESGGQLLSERKGLLPEQEKYPAREAHDRSRGQWFPLNFRYARAPLTERALVTIWQRFGLPLPVELFVGGTDVFYSPDFVLPPSRAKRKILTVHDLSFKRVPETAVPSLKWYLEGAVPRAVKRADLIFADSDATRADLIELFGAAAERVQTLYSGVEDLFRPVTDAEVLRAVRCRHALTKPFILSVGTIEPRKNLVRLIEAYSRLRQIVDLDLVIAGGRGWMYDQIYRSPEEFGVGRNVRFLGYVPEADLPALYSLATLFVYPSLYEGFGLPVLEALACGAPVITSDNSSLPEVAGDAAILVDPRDTEALKEAMARLADDETMRVDLSRRGPERARKFSWDASARQLRAAFEN
jgi:glycosyltransferase involved in cell wall biosynthesis